MKRINIFCLCVFLVLFLFSCATDTSTDTEKIEVDNRTEEDVVIYFYSVVKIEVRQAIIRHNQKRFVNFTPDVEYYARGEKTKKEYGERTFVKLPSSVSVQRAWVIM